MALDIYNSAGTTLVAIGPQFCHPESSKSRNINSLAQKLVWWPGAGQEVTEGVGARGRHFFCDFPPRSILPLSPAANSQLRSRLLLVPRRRAAMKPEC